MSILVIDAVLHKGTGEYTIDWLCDHSISERLSSADLHCYVMVLYKLVPQLQSPRQCLFDEDSDDEDEEYEMDASSVSNALEPGPRLNMISEKTSFRKIS